ncbi:hypothetical protein GCM10027449_00480 [Sinomonas notoginsengisoli]
MSTHPAHAIPAPVRPFRLVHRPTYSRGAALAPPAPAGIPFRKRLAAMRRWARHILLDEWNVAYLEARREEVARKLSEEWPLR